MNSLVYVDIDQGIHKKKLTNLSETSYYLHQNKSYEFLFTSKRDNLLIQAISLLEYQIIWEIYHHAQKNNILVRVQCGKKCVKWSQVKSGNPVNFLKNFDLICLKMSVLAFLIFNIIFWQIWTLCLFYTIFFFILVVNRPQPFQNLKSFPLVK